MPISSSRRRMKRRPSGTSVPAAQRPARQRQQREKRTGRHTENRPGRRRLRRGLHPLRQHPRERETHDELARRLDDLAHRRRQHPPLPLRIAADGREQAHAEERRRQRADGLRREVVVQQRRERVRQQEHQPAADQPQHEKQTQRHAEDAPALVDAPERVRLGHEPRQRQRQTRRRHGQKHAVDIVGRLKRAHALFAKQVSQRNFIDRADELCDGDGPGQNGRAAEKAAPFSSGHRYPPFKFLMGKGRSPLSHEEDFAALHTLPHRKRRGCDTALRARNISRRTRRREIRI